MAQQDVVEEVHAPNGGLQDTVNLDLLQGSEASEMVNMHHDRLSLDRRQGRVQIGKPIPDLVCYSGFHFRKLAVAAARGTAAVTGIDQFLRVQGPYLYVGSGGEWRAAVTLGVAAGPFDWIGNESGLGTWVQYAARAYYFDTTPEHRYWDGGNLVQYGTGGGLELPAGTLASPGTPGRLLAGKYAYVYTYFNPTTGEETNPSAPSNEVTLAAPDLCVNATVPANGTGLKDANGEYTGPNNTRIGQWNPTFSTIRFWRTKKGGLDTGKYNFDHEVYGVTSLPITEKLERPDDTLESEVSYSHGAVPRLRYAILFNEMIVGAGDPSAPSTVFWSVVNDPTHWPPENAQNIDNDSGDPITGIFRLLGRLYIVKQTSGIYMLTPQFDSDGTVRFTVDAITSDFGCLSHHAIVVIDTFAYWPDAKGICKFNGQQVLNVSDPKIRVLWKRLASARTAAQCVAIHDRQADHQYYRLTICDPADTFTYLTGETYQKAYDIIYDVSLGCWFKDLGASGPTGWSNKVVWLGRDANGGYSVYQADQTGRCFRLRTDMAGNVVYDDAGQPILSRWKSKWWGSMDGLLPLYVDFEVERSMPGETSGPVTVNLYADGQTTPRVVDSTSIVLYDVNSPVPSAPDVTLPDPTRISHTVHVNFDAEWCRRCALEVVCNQTDSDLKILWFKFGYQPQGPMTKAK